ncbi:MAG: hypothetical protein M3Q89_13570 [Verrucomicrobiota bacterium]|nr:hypothetical protein [Verrucomicrobiota bacterium]
MFKNLFEKGKCLVGLHQGEWQYEKPGQCEQLRVCSGCGAQNRKTEHVWGEWGFETEGKCAQQRVCGRCGAPEQRIEHTWGALRYQAPDSCEEVRDCDRCHEVWAAGPRHEWNAWQYATSDACGQNQICSRCGVAGAQNRVVHRWRDWQHSAHHGGAVRVCRQCGEMEVPVTVAETAVAAGATTFPGGISESDVTDFLRRAGVPEEAETVAPSTATGTIDQRLIGHWRHTSAMSSGGFSMVTDTNWILDGDARFARYSHTESGMGGNRSDPIGGAWEASSGVLRFKFDDGDVAEHVYEVQGDQLFLPREGHLRFWERI